MLIFPAIDLYEGKAVRLYKGSYDQMTIYSDKPVEVAAEFKKCGAQQAHIVDLEGARYGTTPNFDIIKAIIEQTGLSVEVGGGIRSFDTIEKYLSAGAARVILGTAAVTDEDFLIKSVSTYGSRIAVGVDVKDGFAAIRGWTEKSSYTLETFVDKLCGIGVSTLICTDISRDGALKGVNRSLYGELGKKYSLDIIASGGVTDIDDIKALAELKLYGAIIGKAYYSGLIDIKEAIEVAKC